MNKGIRKFAVIAVLGIVLSGCAVEYDVLMFKQRFDEYFNILNEEERAKFRAQDFAALGEAVEKRTKEDPAFNKAMSDVKIHEAITTFDGETTARFFYEYMLRELNRKNYHKFMRLLNEDEILLFAQKSDKFPEIITEKRNKDRNFDRFIENLTENYALYEFSDYQLTKFFRDVTFAEATRRHFYDLLSVLKKSNGLQAFLDGDIDFAALHIVKTTPAAEMEYNEFRRNSGLVNMSVPSVLRVYYEIVINEMDSEAVAKTIAKF